MYVPNKLPTILYFNLGISDRDTPQTEMVNGSVIQRYFLGFFTYGAFENRGHKSYEPNCLLGAIERRYL